MSNTPDAELLARFLSGECTAEEVLEIDEWIHLKPENKKVLEVMKKAWKPGNSGNHKWDTQKLWANIVREAGIPQPYVQRPKIFKLIGKPSRFGLLKIAAVFLLLVSAPFIISKLPVNVPFFSQSSQMKEIAVENGKRANLTLKDGSKVILDAGSTFNYPEQFADDKREVYLNGEGYFEVEHNPERPFIVHANSGVIKVHGTKFNINSWKRKNIVRVVVSDGTVSLQADNLNGSGQEVMINKGQMSILPENGIPEQAIDVNIAKYFSWLNYEKDFNSVPLREVLDLLERWYDIKISVSDEKHVSDLITVHIEKQPVGNILNMIAMIMNMKYELKDKDVVFSSKTAN